MAKLKKNWFDRIQLNFKQAPEGFIGVHAFKLDKYCEYFEVPLDWLEYDEFFGMVYERTKELWDGEHKHLQIICPICGHTFLPFHFRYKGCMFCRWCGSHYYLKGTKVVITRSIAGTT
jgi:hypothetical protein